MLAADVVPDTLLPTAGTLTATRADAARTSVDRSVLTAYAASAQRRTWWRERLTRAHALL